MPSVRPFKQPVLSISRWCDLRCCKKHLNMLSIYHFVILYFCDFAFHLLLLLLNFPPLFPNLIKHLRKAIYSMCVCVHFNLYFHFVSLTVFGKETRLWHLVVWLLTNHGGSSPAARGSDVWKVSAEKWWKHILSLALLQYRDCSCCD